ncbi:MAG: MCP four helix bundle domain-containing protein, partial [Burkholderiaceae bacterium]|nr:MCP four helix bundle domain-containing protein [Burkholderiaceae bacterium]
MQFLNNWRLRTRVLAGFTVVIALLVGASMIGVMRIAQLNDRIDQMVDVDMHALELSRQWAGLTEISIQRRIVDLAVDDPTFVKAFTRKSKETSARIDKVQEELKKLEKSPEAARLTETIGAQRKAYQMLRDDVTKQKKDGENVQSRVVNELIPAMEAYLDAINAFAENSHTELQAAKQTAQEQEQATRKLVLGLLAISTALGIGVALVITNSVTGPLGEARTLAMAIAEGNLSTRVVTHGRDEVAELNRTLD